MIVHVDTLDSVSPVVWWQKDWTEGKQLNKRRVGKELLTTLQFLTNQTFTAAASGLCSKVPEEVSLETDGT